MDNTQEIKIERDANGNIFVSGNSNIVTIQASQISEASAPEIVPAIGRNPYKGLLTFLEEDTQRFFGRETLVQEIWQRFSRFYAPSGKPSPLRLLAILGPSGSGKSSVIRAGFIPELARNPLPGMQKQARVAVLQPGEYPLRALAAVLARIATNDPAPVTKTREFAEELARQNRDGVYDGLSRIAELLPETHHAPLIVLVDQCEELYTACQEREHCEAFLGNLLQAAATRAPHVSIILTLRSDFLGHTQHHPAFNHAIAANEIIVPVMTDAELHDAIAKPAEHADHPLEEGTIQLLIEQSEGRAGALPLLQFALERIWDEMAKGVEPAETLKQIGGVGGALAHKAQELYDGLDETEQAIARRAFLGMIQLGEGMQDTRRRVPVSNIIAQGEVPQQVHAVLQRFSQQSARLITLSAEQGDTNIVEVTHEALISHWETLQEWLKSSRDDMRFGRRLDDAAHHWEQQKRPEGLLWRSPDLDILNSYHERAACDMNATQLEFFNASSRQTKRFKQKTRLVIAGLVLLTILMSAAAGMALLMYNQAQRRLLISTAQSLVITANQETQNGKRERAALLLRQAYHLYQRNREQENEQTDVNDQIGDVLRITFLGEVGETEDLVEQICRKVSRNLTEVEWRELVGPGIPHKLCPELGTGLTLKLRREAMTTKEMQDLSFNLRVDGYPATDFDNKFTVQGDVIVDDVTDLMWQKSGSGDSISYEEAEKYIQQLNQENFAGYNDWRLPTIEELLSLLENEEQSNDLYIDPLFDSTQTGVWSADIYRIKSESLPKSVWRVFFTHGLVYVHNIESEYYVRAVRSRQ